MKRWLGRYSDLIYAVMRLVVGLLFACHGAQKLFGLLGGESQLSNPMMLAAGVIEFAGGLLVALGLLVMEAAVRRLVLPDAWLAALRRRTSPQDGTEPEPEYETLRETIAAVRTRHLAALREGGHYDTDDAAVRARLYRARARGKD